MAVRDIAGQGLADSLSSLSILSSDCSASTRQADALHCNCAAAAAVEHSQTKVDVNASKAPATDSRLTAAASSSRDDGTSNSVNSALYLLQGLSHCSYHEPSLLVLAGHATYDVVVDLFVCLWHQLQMSQQPDDKTQVRILLNPFSEFHV